MRTLLAAALAVVATHTASADTLTYENDRFGTTVSFPAEVFDGIELAPTNGDGRTFTSEDGAQLAVFGRHNIDDWSADELLDRLTRIGSNNDAEATYTASGDSWVVVSGYDGDSIYYERHEFGADGVIHAVSLRYPTGMREKYDPLVKPITRSLQGP